MRTWEASGLNTEWVRDRIDVSHMCSESWRKSRVIAGNQNLRWPCGSCGKGHVQLLSRWVLTVRHIVKEDVGDKLLDAGLSLLGAALNCDAVKVTGTQRATYSSPKGIPRQHLRSGVCGHEMATMCFWKLLLKTAIFSPSRINNDNCRGFISRRAEQLFML